jgi:hypothetical protein
MNLSEASEGRNRSLSEHEAKQNDRREKNHEAKCLGT